MNQNYIDTVRLLLDIAPAVFASPRFAMKGGTALNLFIQDMPRLSVDIDVAFTDHALPRDEALKAIDADLADAAKALESRGYATVRPRKDTGEDVKLLVRSDTAEVKVEVNQIFRGVLMPTRQTSLGAAAQDRFTSGLTVPMLDYREVYGGKLAAAMDRQHPRDIFDVLKMYEKYGLDAAFVDCFVAYLAGHGRPVHEVLFSTDKPLEAVYEQHFKGMTMEDVALKTLEETRMRLKTELPRALSAAHKEFLLSLVRLEPAWDLMPFKNLHELPALRWKLANLERLRAFKREVFKEQSTLLKKRLDALA